MKKNYFIEEIKKNYVINKKHKTTYTVLIYICIPIIIAISTVR